MTKTMDEQVDEQFTVAKTALAEHVRLWSHCCDCDACRQANGHPLPPAAPRGSQATTKPKGATTWTWVPPKNQNELLQRLGDARDLDVPPRERENLCACAYREIVRLQRDALEQHAAGCAESARADAAEQELIALRDRTSGEGQQ